MRITKLWPQLSLFGDFHSMSVTRYKILERGFKIESNFFFILALQWNISCVSEGFLKKKIISSFFLAKTYKILRKNGKNNINKTKNSVVLQIFEKKKNASDTHEIKVHRLQLCICFLWKKFPAFKILFRRMLLLGLFYVKFGHFRKKNRVKLEQMDKSNF